MENDRGWDSPITDDRNLRAHSLFKGTMIEKNNIYFLNFLAL